MKKILFLAILFLSQIGLAALPCLIKVSNCPTFFARFNQLYYKSGATTYTGITDSDCLIRYSSTRWTFFWGGMEVALGIYSSPCDNTVSPTDADWNTTENRNYTYTSGISLVVSGSGVSGINQTYYSRDTNGVWDSQWIGNEDGNYDIIYDGGIWFLRDGDSTQYAHKESSDFFNIGGTWITDEGGGTIVVTPTNTTESFVPAFENVDIAISTPDELQAIGTNAMTLAGSYVQTENITVSPTIANFVPIGTLSTPFIGTYDGQNFTISTLVINRSTTDYVGLFGRTGNDNGTVYVRNVKLSSPVITGQDYVGSLCGSFASIPAANGLYNCHATNVTVVGRQTVGGLVGNLSTSNRTNTYVKNCSVVGGNVSSNTNSVNRVVGGFSGTGNSKIETCFTTGVTITIGGSASEAGGFSGRCNWGIHTNCYARNTLAGATTTVGSYFGGSLSSSGVCVFTNCYAVSGIDLFRGGAISGTDPTIVSCYFQGTGTDNGATGKTEAQMKYRSTFQTWDVFPKGAKIWKINPNSYPDLSWNTLYYPTRIEQSRDRLRRTTY